VSHSLFTLDQLCDKLIWIDEGQVRAIGTPGDIIPQYCDVMGITEWHNGPAMPMLVG
jgi:ABC-type polysaccharide/polyol phosphate transport system ATPase subunit